MVFYNQSLVWLLVPTAGLLLRSKADELIGLLLGCWHEEIRVSACSPQMWLWLQSSQNVELLQWFFWALVCWKVACWGHRNSHAVDSAWSVRMEDGNPGAQLPICLGTHRLKGSSPGNMGWEAPELGALYPWLCLSNPTLRLVGPPLILPVSCVTKVGYGLQSKKFWPGQANGPLGFHMGTPSWDFGG